MKIKQLIYALLCNLALLTVTGCVADELLPTPSTGLGETVRVAIDARIDPIIVPDAAIGSLKSVAVTELKTYQGMILQFDAAGLLLHHTPATAIEIDENRQFAIPEFELRQGEKQTLVLLIAPDANALAPFATLTTLSDFENTPIGWNGIGSTDQLPLTGRLDNIAVSPYGITSTEGTSLFRLRRLGCRIDFSYSFNVPGYTLERIMIHNLPKAMAVAPGNQPYPAITTSEQLMQEVITPVGTSGTFRWFIPANARGIGRNTSGDAKHKIAANAPDGFCTYLQIECTSNTDNNERVRFNLYLGDDAVNDFNLKANHAYRITANLTGLNENDLRIEGLGNMEAWIEVKDLDLLHGNKKFSSLRYTLDDGEVRHHPITRTSGNRYYYNIPRNLGNDGKRIREIGFRDIAGNPVTLVMNGGLQIESNGDANIASDGESLKAGIFYSWILQGIYNRAGEYEVCSSRTLSNVKRLLNAKFRQVNDIALQTYASWEPIGSYEAPFRGSYYGDGYRIGGMQLNQKNTTKALGLFGATSDAMLDGIRITSNNTIACLGSYIGSVVGYAYNTKITRCSNGASITVLMENQYGQNVTYTHTGGIAGYMDRGEIRNCYNRASFGAVWWYHGAAGGIVGTFNNISHSRIKSCYYTGVLYEVQGNERPVYRGGIIGVSNDLRLVGNTLYPTGFMADCYAHKERSNEVIGYPYYNDVTYLIGDYYGLWNTGMKSDYFRDILNQAEPVGTWMRTTTNEGYPHLGIEKP